ncbi:acyltransferase domain-containing protein, partial [Actinocorallia aurantiaca]|uniref:acyltransferase domain-containing protein n=1 Tax=Actinocorallia aurantiaca TaxID=46204 RepID=UPI0031DCF0C2
SGRPTRLRAAQDALGPPPRGADAGTTAGGVVAWVVQGRDGGAVREGARRLGAWVEETGEVDLEAVAAALGRRAVLPERAVVVGSSDAELRAGLEAVAEGADVPGAVRGTAAAGARTVFVFPGQGSQWPGMAAELRAASPVFAAALAECAAALRPFTDWELDAVLDDPAALERVDVVQPALWAVMVSLARVWEAAGVVPDAVAGHSQGEIAAACAAGALSIEDGARIVALRSRMIRSLSGSGGMASVALPADEAREELRAWPGRLDVAAVNGPQTTIVSGDAAALEEFLGRCAELGVFARRVNVDYASHSPHVERVRDGLLEALAPVRPRDAATAVFHSTVRGGPCDPSELTAAYWVENLRRPVLFQPVVEGLAAAGPTVFVEISPHPVLTGAIQDTAPDAAVSG